MIGDIIPMVIMTGMFAMIFGIVYIRSRENMALIEKGLNPRNIKATPKPFISLKYGLLMIGAGLGLISAYFIDQNMSHKGFLPNGEVYYLSLIHISEPTRPY